MSQLKELRKQHGYDSIRSLAKDAGVAWDTIRNIEEGKVTNPQYATLKAISDALGSDVDPDDIMK